MIDLAIAPAVAAVAGGSVAVTVRNRRGVAFGLALALGAAPLAASPLPGTLSVAARVVGALLAAELLLVACRVKRVRSEGSALGLVAEAAIAAAAFVVGLWISPVKPLLGPATEQAAGLALVALSIIPMTGKDVLRIGVGAILLGLGLSLLREAWLGPAQPFEDLVLAGLFAAIAGATGLLIAHPGRPADEAELAADMDAVGAVEAADMEAVGAVEAAELNVEIPDDRPAVELPRPLGSLRPGSMVRRTRSPRGIDPRK